MPELPKKYFAGDTLRHITLHQHPQSRGDENIFKEFSQRTTFALLAEH